MRAQGGSSLSDPAALGAFVRAERKRQRMTQEHLGVRAQVSRRWLSDLEAGKPTAEIGLVIRVMNALGLELRADSAREEFGTAAQSDVDLDEVLRAYLGPAGEGTPDA